MPTFFFEMWCYTWICGSNHRCPGEYCNIVRRVIGDFWPLYLIRVLSMATICHSIILTIFCLIFNPDFVLGSSFSVKILTLNKIVNICHQLIDLQFKVNHWLLILFPTAYLLILQLLEINCSFETKYFI